MVILPPIQTNKYRKEANMKVVDLRQEGKKYSTKDIATIYKVTTKGTIRIEVPKDHPDIAKLYKGSAKHLWN